MHAIDNAKRAYSGDLSLARWSTLDKGSDIHHHPPRRRLYVPIWVSLFLFEKKRSRISRLKFAGTWIIIYGELRGRSTG